MKRVFKFSLLLFCIVSFSIKSYSQTSYGKPDYEKEMIKYLHLCYAATDGKFGMVIDRIEPVYYENRLHSMIVYFVFPSTGPFVGEYCDYIIVKPEGFIITKFDGLDGKGFLYIDGNNPSLGFRTMRADIQKSQDLKTITLNILGFDYNNKYISKKSIVGSYNDNGDLIKVVEKVFAGKGKDAQKVKFDTEFVVYEATIERSFNGVKVFSKEFDAIYGKTITTSLIKEKTIEFIRDGNTTTLKSEDGITINRYNAGKLVETQKGDKLFEYEYDENGFLKVLRTNKKDNNAGKLTKTEEVLYDYELVSERPKGLWDSYKPTKRSLEYDSNGVAIKERKPGFVRVKESNGDWGAWIQSRY